MSVTAAGFVEFSNPLMQGMKRLGFLIADGLRISVEALSIAPQNGKFQSVKLDKN